MVWKAVPFIFFGGAHGVRQRPTDGLTNIGATGERRDERQRARASPARAGSIGGRAHVRVRSGERAEGGASAMDHLTGPHRLCGRQFWKVPASLRTQGLEREPCCDGIRTLWAFAPMGKSRKCVFVATWSGRGEKI